MPGVDPAALCSMAAVLVVAGKGGVGKTTVSAALANLAARRGRATLVLEVESTTALPALFGQEGVLGYEETVLATAQGGRAEIRARALTPDDALLEYLQDHGMHRISRRLNATGTLEIVATAVPGIKDILVLGKVKQLERAMAAGVPGSPDLIVVDAPAAGHAVTFLASAHGLLDAAAVGPIRSQAADVVALLVDPSRCRVVLVTLPEETPVNEVVETAFHLEDRAGVQLAPVVVNGLWPILDLPPVPDYPAEAPLARSLRRALGPRPAEVLARAADFRRHRQAIQAEQVSRLSSALPLPQLRLPYLFTTEVGPTQLEVLTDALEAEVDALDASRMP